MDNDMTNEDNNRIRKFSEATNLEISSVSVRIVQTSIASDLDESNNLPKKPDAQPG